MFFCSQRRRPQTPQGNSGPAWQELLLFSGYRSFQNRCSNPHQPRCCLSCFCPPLAASCHRPSLTKPRRPKAQKLPEKPQDLFAPRAPDPGASPGTDLGLSGNPRTISGELWMGLGLGFSKGHMGGARDFVPEAPSALGEVPGQAPPLSSPSLGSPLASIL